LFNVADCIDHYVTDDYFVIMTLLLYTKCDEKRIFEGKKANDYLLILIVCEQLKYKHVIVVIQFSFPLFLFFQF